MPSYSIVEKIITRKSGRSVKVSDIVIADIDCMVLKGVSFI